MKEAFLHYIWKFQNYNHRSLTNDLNEEVKVVNVGFHNQDAGPDFLNAKVVMKDIVWCGNVEIHVNSSDWVKHLHQHDAAYNNVILHVVWNNDCPVFTPSGNEIRVVELKNKIDPIVFSQCESLLKSTLSIPCQNQLSEVKSIDVLSMLSDAGVHRLEQKSGLILEMLEKNKGSWEETAYQRLCANFGFKTNEEPFSKLARILPLKTLLKLDNYLKSIEALMYGVAGYLDADPVDDYSEKLLKEYNYLKQKFQLSDLELKRMEWKFLRMRPSNFPTLRISQMAALISRNNKLFSQIIHFDDIKSLKKMFIGAPSDYWKKHYDFGKTASRISNGMGQSSVDVLLINTVAPLLAAYAKSTGDYAYMQKAMDLLESIKPESNKIISKWKSLGVKAKNAFDSQALISLNNDYCQKKKCLSCKIGISLLGK